MSEGQELYRTLLFETLGQGYSLAEVVRNAAGRVIDHRLLEVNAAIEQVLGILMAEVAGRLVSELVPDLEAWWLETFERILRNGVPERIEHSVASLGRWYQVYLYPVGSDQFISIYEDITERKRIELAARESERHQAF